MITKITLNSISTKADPCADDETFTMSDYAIKKVNIRITDLKK